MAANSTYIGAGTSLSSDFYKRNFYISNRDAATSSKRRNLTGSKLSLADGMALRRAVKKLGSMEFSKEKDADIRNAVSACIETYNNAITSATDSGDHNLKRTQKQMKAIANEYADELDRIGITVNSDGTMTKRDSLFGSASLEKFEKLFSKDSDFMQRTSSCAKRIEHRSETLILTEQNQKKQQKSAAAIAAGLTPGVGPDLELLLNTGVGKNVNLSL